MRTKSIGGGRARLCKLPPRPSAMAFSYLGQSTDSEVHPDCPHDGVSDNEVNNYGHYGRTVPETSTDNDRHRQCHELAHKTTTKTAVVAEKPCAPQDTRELEDCLEMDWTEKEVCIKCDKGGKLLVCSDSNCPLAVHEECMSCSTRFDSMGNFYCPYCSYKRAVLETCKAKKKVLLAKKALSLFLDKGMVDGGLQMQKVERVKRKQPNPVVVKETQHDDTRKRLDGDEFDKHFTRTEADQFEKRFDPESSTVSSRDGAKASEVNEKNDLNKCGDNATTDDSGQDKIVVEQHMHPVPIVACVSRCGSGGGGMNEETGHGFEILQVEVPQENPRVLQDEQQAGPLSASPVQKEAKLDVAHRINTEGELDKVEIVKEHEAVMQDQEQGTTVSSSGGAAMQQENAIASEYPSGDSGDISPHWRRIKKNRIVVRSPYFSHPRRSPRKVPKLDTNVVHTEKKNAIPKSSERCTNPTFPHARRKKLPWTDEEEEMLKEGVQKFSTMVDKKFPWRKVLDFGRHVFDGTRTPGDLKDKWRNIFLKERSKK